MIDQEKVKARRRRTWKKNKGRYYAANAKRLIAWRARQKRCRSLPGGTKTYTEEEFRRLFCQPYE